MIQNEGQVWIGSSDCPFTSQLTITLYGVKADASTPSPFGAKYIGIDSGQLQIHGSPTTRWTNLESTAPVGATTITLMKAVNWPVGGEIVVASTDYETAQSERRIITAVSADKKTLTLNQSLAYMHFADYVGSGSHRFPIRAEVGYLNRNIVIKSSMAGVEPGFGGHLMAMGGLVQIEEVEFLAMGQTGIKARYPVHFHLAGDSMPQSWVKNLAIHDNFQRCVTIHGTNNIRIEGCTSFNNKGHCYFVEDGNEVNNTFIENLGITAIQSNNEQMLPSDGSPSIFWITNPNNHLIRNAGCGADNVIWIAIPRAPTGNAWGQGPELLTVPMGIFKDNVAHTCGDKCLFVDHGPDRDGNTGEGKFYGPRNYDTFKDDLRNIGKYGDRKAAVFDGALLYKSSFHGCWARGDSQIFKRFLFADNGAGHQFAGSDMRLQDSIMIGKSQNIGSGFPANSYGRSRPYDSRGTIILGYRFYHDIGPTALINVHFENFYDESFPDGTKGPSGAIGTEIGHYAIYIGRSRFFNVTFTNTTTRFLINDYYSKGDVNANMLDHEGFITGKCGGQILAESNWLRYDKENSCEHIPSWKAYVCPANYTALRPIIIYDDTNLLFKASDGNSYNRSVGRLYSLYGNKEVAEMGGDPTASGSLVQPKNNLDWTRAYRAIVPMFGDYIMRWGSDITPRRSRFMLQFTPAGEWINVGIPYPIGTNFTIYTAEVYWPLKQTNSKANLDLTNYYWDNIYGLLWIRLGSFSDRLNWLPRTSPYAPFALNDERALNIIASCTNCTAYVNPASLGSFPFTPKPPVTARCGELWPGGYTKFSASNNTYTIFNGSALHSNWAVTIRGGVVGHSWGMGMPMNNPSGNFTGWYALQPGIPWFYRKDRGAVNFDASNYTHFKMVIRTNDTYERPASIGVQFWNGTGESWDNNPVHPFLTELSNPFYMTYPPVNETWKEVYIPLQDLQTQKNVAAFRIYNNNYQAQLTMFVSEISLVNVRTSVEKVDEPLCWGKEGCDFGTTNIVPSSGQSGASGSGTSVGNSNGNSNSNSLAISDADNTNPEDVMESGSVNFFYFCLATLILILVI